MTPRVLLAVIVLVLIAFVVACHDEIPVVMFVHMSLSLNMQA